MLNVCRPSRIASALQAQDSNVGQVSPAVSGKSHPFCLGGCTAESVSTHKDCPSPATACPHDVHHAQQHKGEPEQLPCPSSAVAKHSEMWQHAGSRVEHTWRFV